VTLPTVSIGGRQVRVSARGEPGEEDLVALREMLSDPDSLDRRCRAAIRQDAEVDAEGPSRLYVIHHLGQLDRLAPRSATAAPQSPTTSAVDAFLASMSVDSIWATPESDDTFLHVDYTIDSERTDYVLSVTLDRRGTVESVEMER